MELKHYQRRVCDELERWFGRVADARAAGLGEFASMKAWNLQRDDRGIAAEHRPHGEYQSKTNANGEDLPHVCVKMPTGGGKTLIGVQALISAHRTLLRDRAGAGLAVWVVPSDQIYRDTLRGLTDADPRKSLRDMLRHGLGREVNVWKKEEMHRLSPNHLVNQLNILLVQLASTNRETKDQLGFFKVSSGSIVRHFPPETALPEHAERLKAFPGLDVIEGTAGQDGRGAALKTSVANLVHQCRPVVILDEGHKATSDLARETIEKRFNASVVVELSATPNKKRAVSNVLCRAGGRELLAEEMIKLPMNVAAAGSLEWKPLLARARDRRLTLAKLADDYAAAVPGEAPVRPIVVVQVERTGKDQRGDKRFIHAEDVREHLVGTLGVPGRNVAVQSSSTKELLDHENLEAPGCPVEWIITKAALQEGWDCPFAYLLVSLAGSKSNSAMTQLIGRVLRQPGQRRFPEPAYAPLNESYVYCLKRTAADITRQVKTALEDEGYEDAAAAGIAVEGDDDRVRAVSRMLPRFAALYAAGDEARLDLEDGGGTVIREGAIYLPRACVLPEPESDAAPAPLDYYLHLAGAIDEAQFPVAEVGRWAPTFADDLKAAKDRFYRTTLGDAGVDRVRESDVDAVETDAQTLNWLTASLAQDPRAAVLGFKRLGRFLHAAHAQIRTWGLTHRYEDRLGLIRFALFERLATLIAEACEAQTKARYLDLERAGRLGFEWTCHRCRAELPAERTVSADPADRVPWLMNEAQPLQRSLFDRVPQAELNDLERNVALYLDNAEGVLWWARNMPGPEAYRVTGWKRGHIYPDFVVQRTDAEGGIVILETKGAHLRNEDTAYKQAVADRYDRMGRRFPWQRPDAGVGETTLRMKVADEQAGTAVPAAVKAVAPTSAA